MKTTLITLLLAGAASTASAYAGGKCDVPVADWQPRGALETKLEDNGWDVRRIKTEDGCYEAYAIDDKGNKVEASFNPKTLERVLGSDSDSDDEDEG